MKITATEIKNHFGQYLEESISGPVFIEKTGRSVAVMVSAKEYERLTSLEDAYWAQKAGYIGKKESAAFLRSK